MLPFGVTISATVPQRSEIPEGLTNYPVFGGSLHTVKKKHGRGSSCYKEIRLEVYSEETKYMAMSRDQNAGRNNNIENDNKTFERVERFRYLGTTATNQNPIQEEIKSWLKSGNACYLSVQNVLPSSVQSINIKIHKNIRNYNLPVGLYGCEIWSLTLREEHRLRVFENRILRTIFVPKRAR